MPRDEPGWVDDSLIWLLLVVGAGVLIAGALLVGVPVGDALFRGQRLHPFPAYAPEVMPKPAQFGRFAIAILVTFATAGAILALPRTKAFAGVRALGRAAPFAIAAGQLAALAVAVWAWRGQNTGINYLTPVQFHLRELVVAILIAAALTLSVTRGWLKWMGSHSDRRGSVIWAGAAMLITALWLLPALYRSLNLAHALPGVWYPLQFTFDDLVSVLDGRTPLVNYDPQYASLLPFVAEPFFKVFGTSVGTFTAVMCALSLLSFMCIERSLAMIARDERTAFVLYVPLLAISLFTILQTGDERYFMANYYAVIPIRYIGPYVIFWCTMRHLNGSQPRRPTLLFVLATLVAINNSEFGVPALGGCFLALASGHLVPRAGAVLRLRRLLRQLLVGLIGAILLVSAFVVLRSGSLPQFSRLTRFEQIYGITGFNDLPTPTAGLHIIIFMTFAASLILAALRIRAAHPDRLLTGGLVFSGTFGMGAGSYYMGRSHPQVLTALFSVWGLATVLLCLVALENLTDPERRRQLWPWRSLPVAAALVLLGLFVTTAEQFPAPWTQWQRLTSDSHALVINTAPATRFVRGATRHGEDVVLLTGLGHLIARDAGVVDVSPYSHPDGIVTYEQLDDVFAALRAAHGGTIFVGAVQPEVVQTLEARGFHVVAQDHSSMLSEWRH